MIVVQNWFEELKRLVPVELMPLAAGTRLGPYEIIGRWAPAAWARSIARATRS